MLFHAASGDRRLHVEPSEIDARARDAAPVARALESTHVPTLRIQIEYIEGLSQLREFYATQSGAGSQPPPPLILARLARDTGDAQDALLGRIYSAQRS